MKHNQPRVIHFYPFLFGIYPALALLAYNIEQVNPSDALRAVLFSFLLSGLLFCGLIFILKNQEKAALITMVFILLFFTYGHVEQLLVMLFPRFPSRYFPTTIFIFYLAVFLIGLWWILRIAQANRIRFQLFSLVSLVLIAFPLIQISWFYLRVGYYNFTVHDSIASVSATTLETTTPDIYWIILDGYTREDVLKNSFQFDNSGFTSELKSLGFTIPNCAQSNYAWTALSLSTTLHMNYLDTFTNFLQRGDQKRNYVSYHYLLENNPVRSLLKDHQYRMIAFQTEYFWANIQDAEPYIQLRQPVGFVYQQGYHVNQFEGLFLQTTLLKYFAGQGFYEMDGFVSNPDTNSSNYHYNLVKFKLDQLSKVPDLPGSKFVMFHVVAPHAPFVFSANGDYQPTDSALEGYPQEVSYLNQRILEIVKTILKKSTTPPVIIIQGDHGWDMETRMDILNAYYLPGGGNAKIYNGITPVNTFRVVLNQYFGMNYPILADISRFSTEQAVYDFNIVPNTCLDQTH